MRRQTEQSVEDFIPFRSGKEIKLWKWFIIGNSFLLLSVFLLVLISDKFFGITPLTLSDYGILCLANIFFFAIMSAVLKKIDKQTSKPLIVIYLSLLISGWIYLTDPEYAKPIFVMSIIANMMMAFVFFDFKLFAIANVATGISWAMIFVNYYRIGTPITFYEIAILYIALIFMSILSFPAIERIKLYLEEVLEQRQKVEEANTILEIKVKARTKELQEVNKNLETMILERTKELEQNKKDLEERVRELEKFHKLTIDRELKMIELKKQLKKSS